MGGILSEKYGGKWVYGISIFMSGALGFILPTMANISSGMLIMVREDLHNFSVIMM
jgi:hypothetical protein